MPYVFEYKSDSGQTFSCDLVCERCTAELVNGRQCARTVCIGLPLCWQHLLSCRGYGRGLKIKDSPIAGKGLFAWSKIGGNDVVFKGGDTIMVYEGERLTRAQLDQRYGKDDLAPYAVGLNREDIDAACRRGAGSIANGAFTKQGANAKFDSRMEGGVRVVRLRATKNIKHGQEVLVLYGDKYWDGPNGTHSTKRRR